MLRIKSVRRTLLAICIPILLQFGASSPPAHAQAEDILAMLKQVGALTNEGKFDEAIALSNRVLAAIGKMAGKEHPLYLSQIAGLGDLYGLAGKNEAAERIHLEALALREKYLGREHADVAASLASLATIYINVARYDDAEAALQRALAIREKALPKSDPNYGFTYVNLGRLYMARSRYADAERALQQAMTLFKQYLPADHVYLLTVTNNLAEAERALGRFAEAERLLHEALAISERTRGAESLEAAPILNNLAQLYQEQGRYEEAEGLMRRELALTEKLLGAEHPSLAVSLNNLGSLLSARGRPKEAVALVRRALQITSQSLGPDHPDVARTLNNLGDALTGLKMPEEAERQFRRSLALRERASGPRDLSLVNSLTNLGTLFHGQKRFAEAESFARRSLEICQEKLPADHPVLALNLGNLAAILDETHRYGEAKQLYERALAIKEAALGKDHPDVAVSLSNLGGNRLDEGDWQAAHTLFRRSSDIWISRRASPGSLGAGDRDSELKRFSDPFLGLLWSGFELHRTADRQTQETLSEEGFAALQWASLSSAASAVSKMAARIAAGSGALSDLVREQQDLTAEADALDKALIVAISSAPAARSKEGEADLRERAEAVRKRLAELTQQLSAQFPEFAALTSPEPRSIAAVQKALRPQEALYAFTFTRGGGFAWLITPETARWVHIARTTKEIESDVAALRCGLDTAAWSDPKTHCAELTGTQYSEADQRAGRLPSFDLDRAHQLYRTLFDQVEDLIRGRHLIVVPADALTQLPFQVLVTEPPPTAGSEAERYRRAAWFARQTPMTVLPAISSLDALRQRAGTSAAPEPYLGFGNPLLDGPDKRYAELAALARAKQSCANQPPPRFATLPEPRGIAGRMVTSGGLVDPDFLRAQPPLPETADELCTVAKNLNVGGAAVQLGRNAEEANIKRFSERGDLARYRVLHFATHGAMAGEVSGAAEPGVILTPPDKASDFDDGYLSASEIASLRLDADLVILSACNTAAAGAEDSGTLSGLARSFFYAGARALLVSHWAVNSAATVKLITGALGTTARDASVDHAEALRRSMLSLIASGAANDAHPANWAPFVVVGGLTARH